MIDETQQQNEYVIKLSGKAHLFEPLKIGHNFEVLAKGSITEEKKRDKDDGGFIVTWRFEPVTIEVKSELGETLKAKDTRSRSRQLRSALFRKWREENVNQEFEDWYDEKMLEIIKQVIEKEI